MELDCVVGWATRRRRRLCLVCVLDRGPGLDHRAGRQALVCAPIGLASQRALDAALPRADVHVGAVATAARVRCAAQHRDDHLHAPGPCGELSPGHAARGRVHDRDRHVEGRRCLHGLGALRAAGGERRGPCLCRRSLDRVFDSALGLGAHAHVVVRQARGHCPHAAPHRPTTRALAPACPASVHLQRAARSARLAPREAAPQADG
eukprot:Amastigsp_a1309_61.p4 type:complete len:206 gc:universal Amastigsp_a1309_61:640-1257(+)